MIDIKKAKLEFQKFLEKYESEGDLSFKLKVTHTYHVVDCATKIATSLNLSEEDINLAQLIALLHDIGRFEEITVLKSFNSTRFDHAAYGVKMLFEDNLIRNFVSDDSYDEIIKVVIDNHSRLSIEDGLSVQCLLHAKIIRDADKVDNFRVKKEERIEANFPGIARSREDIENSSLSNKVYETVMSKKCVNIHDRTTVLDYWVCILAFVFDLNFKESYKMIIQNNYIDTLINQYKYNDLNTKNQMENIRNLINEYLKN